MLGNNYSSVDMEDTLSIIRELFPQQSWHYILDQIEKLRHKVLPTWKIHLQN